MKYLFFSCLLLLIACEIRTLTEAEQLYVQGNTEAKQLCLTLNQNPKITSLELLVHHRTRNW